MSKAKFHHVVPFLPVRDLVETVYYYKTKLGFYNEWFWEESDAGVSRDELSLLFTKNPEHLAKINDGEMNFELMWFVESVDEIYKEFKNNHISFARELQDEPWGQREFAFHDINGYYIRVSQQLEASEEEPEE
jgi:uncharacterized glyoxalase superfamily protein PhnB